MNGRNAIGMAMFLAVFLTFSMVHAQPMGYGMMGQGYGYQQPGGWNYCPYCGNSMGWGDGYGMGPGMMGQGRGMGPGMMNRGYGMGGQQYGPPYGPQYGPQYQQPPRNMEEEDVRVMLENYLKSTRNPNLKLGKIQEKDSVFEAEILTKDGSLVDKIAVDKATGWMRSVY